jgi:diguanylate cyclase (GGDEF)-like protein
VSFRGKLGLFFFLVVVVPMVSVAFVLFRLVDESATGKADARLASRQEVAVNLTRELRVRSGVIAAEVAADEQVAAALRDGDRTALATRLEQLRQRAGATRIAIVRRNGAVADTGDPDAVFPAFRELTSPDGRVAGLLEVAVADAGPFAERVARVTGLETAVSIGGRVAGATITGLRGTDIPARRGDLRAGEVDYRAASYDAPAFSQGVSRVTVLEPAALTAGSRQQSRALIVVLLLGFFVIALTLTWAVARSLHRSMQRFLLAARRIGAGDYEARVATVGNDDFAALGEEFNKMSVRLQAREHELRRERERLRLAMRRLGQAFASNLDREGLLDVVVTATSEGLAADAGRACIPGDDGALVPVASAGDTGAASAALDEVEREALATQAESEITHRSRAALALPLRAQDGAVVAVVAIARVGGPFSAADREIFRYLAGQAAQSIENVDLHHRIERQAVTDALTGLANRRQFEQRLAGEVERARRFPDQPLALVLLDIDDFKQVNDRLGHVAGDDVLRAVARVLEQDRRDVDLAARYGGEELALILPGAGVEGALRAAERVRTAIAALDLPLEGAEGAPLHVTVSLGVAAFGLGAHDAESLLEAADAALYRAKRAGKNRTEGPAAASSVRAE